MDGFTLNYTCIPLINSRDSRTVWEGCWKDTSRVLSTTVDILGIKFVVLRADFEAQTAESVLENF